MTTPRCELCRFWDGEWVKVPKGSMKEVASPMMAHLLNWDVEDSTERRTCRRMPSHDIRHKDDWCVEFVDAGVDSSPELLEDLKRIIRES